MLLKELVVEYHAALEKSLPAKLSKARVNEGRIVVFSVLGSPCSPMDLSLPQTSIYNAFITKDLQIMAEIIGIVWQHWNKRVKGGSLENGYGDSVTKKDVVALKHAYIQNSWINGEIEFR